MAEAWPSPAVSFTPSTSSTSTSRVRLVECGQVMGKGPRLKPGSAAGHHFGYAFMAGGQRVPVMSSTTQALPNRERDKMRVETTLGLAEFGDAATEFYAAAADYLPVALGYDRILYGDHGPYVEFSPHQICWSTFPNYIEKPEGCYFDEYWTADGTTMIYAQKRHVTCKPNPPGGEWSVHNNRPEGYANYLVGRFYLACEAEVIGVRFSAASAAAKRKRKKQNAGRGKGGDVDAQAGQQPASIAEVEGGPAEQAEGDGAGEGTGAGAAAGGTEAAEAPPGEAAQVGAGLEELAKEAPKDREPADGQTSAATASTAGGNGSATASTAEGNGSAAGRADSECAATEVEGEGGEGEGGAEGNQARKEVADEEQVDDEAWDADEWWGEEEWWDEDYWPEAGWWDDGWWGHGWWETDVWWQDDEGWNWGEGEEEEEEWREGDEEEQAEEDEVEDDSDAEHSYRDDDKDEFDAAYGKDDTAAVKDDEEREDMTESEKDPLEGAADEADGASQGEVAAEDQEAWEGQDWSEAAEWSEVAEWAAWEADAWWYGGADAAWWGASPWDYAAAAGGGWGAAGSGRRRGGAGRGIRASKWTGDAAWQASAWEQERPRSSRQKWTRKSEGVVAAGKAAAEEAPAASEAPRHRAESTARPDVPAGTAAAEAATQAALLLTGGAAAAKASGSSSATLPSLILVAAGSGLIFAWWHYSDGPRQAPAWCYRPIDDPAPPADTPQTPRRSRQMREDTLSPPTGTFSGASELEPLTRPQV